MERILVLAPNWLGDAVMALPAVADVRRAYPNALLTVAARPSIAPLFELVREVDNVVRVDALATTGERDGGARAGFDVALILPNSFHAAWLAWRAGAVERWGYRGDWRLPLLTRSARRPHGLHQVAFYQRLVAAFGIVNGMPVPAIEPDAAVVQAGSRLLRGAGWDGAKPLLGLAPGAAYGGAKRWPPEYFAGLVRRAAADGMMAVLVGSAADEATGAEVEHGLTVERIINLIGRTTLAELAGVLRQCRVVVSNDSGAMHLADAVGARLIALFGPTNERETAPANERRSSILVHPVWCRPCMLRECPIDHGCMRGITVDRVYETLRAMSGSPADVSTATRSTEHVSSTREPSPVVSNRPC